LKVKVESLKDKGSQQISIKKKQVYVHNKTELW